MNEIDLETRLRSIASALEYPRTPDIAGSVTGRLRSFSSPTGRGVKGEGQPRLLSRTWAWSLTIILTLASSLMLIPPARAAILEFIQIGVVRIFRPEPASAPLPFDPFPVTATPATVIPEPASQPLIPLLESLAGETTLAEARKQVDDPILLPAYPPELGEPDRVFVQYTEEPLTILVWLDPMRPESVAMSLYSIPAGSWVINKFAPKIIQETSVNGQAAVWAVGPYPFILRNREVEVRRLMEGHVLIWAEEDVTYRLETDLSLEEAVKVAESLEAIP
jgi:hypothetical protein